MKKVNNRFWWRPERIEFFLEDEFTGELAMIYSTPYIPTEMLKGKTRRFVIQLKKSHELERWLYMHNPQRFPSPTFKLRMNKIFNP